MSQENLSPVRVANPLWRAWWVMLLLGVVATVFGIVAIVWPVQAAAALMRAIGVIAIAEGVVALFGLLGRQLLVPRSWLVFHGVVSIGFGVLAAVFPLQTAGVLVLLLALWLLLGGIFRIAFGIRVRGYVNRAWLIILSGVLSVALGVLFVVSPTSGVAATTLWLGIFAVVYGVFQILVAIYLMRVSR